MSNLNPGRLIIVVGPSGVGKDSILKAAQIHFNAIPRVQFVQRIITRECDPESEIHDSVSEAQFERFCERGDFSVWWRANGLYYGLPVSVHNDIEQGRLMIANGSRGAIDEIRSRFSQLTTVHITACEDVLARRLENRRRESPAEVKNRLNRNSKLAPLIGEDVVTIDNSGELQTAIDRFISLVESF